MAACSHLEAQTLGGLLNKTKDRMKEKAKDKTDNTLTKNENQTTGIVKFFAGCVFINSK